MRPKEFFVMEEIIPGQNRVNLLSLAQSYLIWSEAEQQASPETIKKRIDCLRQVVRIVGEKPVTDFRKSDLLRLKADLVRRNLSPSRQYGILSTLKYFLRYCEKEERLRVFPSEEITFP
jgi:site-specific recombinase XerD